MSEHVGLDRSYLAEVESGKIEICIRNLELVAKGFELETWKLLKLGKRD
jgi:transcriptional regulator with XRE-family HTH domain